VQVNAALAAKLLSARAGAAREGAQEPAADGDSAGAAPAAPASSDEEEDARGGGGEAGRARKRRRDAASSALLEDARFGAMFTDTAFAIDERSEEYKALHPNAGASPTAGRGEKQNTQFSRVFNGV